jgi:hypothetical protein
MPVIILFCAPILMGVTNVLLRHMNMLHEYTSATYTIIMAGIVYGSSILISGESLKIISTIETMDYVIFVTVAL